MQNPVETTNILRAIDILPGRLESARDNAYSDENIDDEKYKHISDRIDAALIMLKYVKAQIIEGPDKEYYAEIYELQWKQKRVHYLNKYSQSNLKSELTDLLTNNYRDYPNVVNELMEMVDFNTEDIEFTEDENNKLQYLLNTVEHLEYKRWQEQLQKFQQAREAREAREAAEQRAAEEARRAAEEEERRRQEAEEAARRAAAVEEQLREGAEALTSEQKEALLRILKAEPNDYRTILNLPQDKHSVLTKVEVTNAFRRASLLVHPDKCHHKSATKASQRLSEARDALINEIAYNMQQQGTGGSNKKTKRKTKRKKQNKRKTKRKKQNKRKTKRKRKSIKRR
jgi:hypothetical protein